MSMIKVLFLCTGNSCRSQMAEGFLKQYSGFEVFSAGTNPGESVASFTVKVMKEAGIDISKQKPESVRRYLNEEFDFVITVCDDAKESCPVFSGKVKKRLHFGFEDPHGKSIEIFRKVRDQIKATVKEFTENVREKK